MRQTAQMMDLIGTARFAESGIGEVPAPTGNGHARVQAHASAAAGNRGPADTGVGSCFQRRRTEQMLPGGGLDFRYSDVGSATGTDADRRAGTGRCELDMTHHHIEAGAGGDFDADRKTAGATSADIDEMQRLAVRRNDAQDLAAGAIGHRPAGSDIVFFT